MDKDITVILGSPECERAIVTKPRLSFWGFECSVVRFEDGDGIIGFLTYIRNADFLLARHYLVLASLSMPQMDGLELLRTIKHDPDFRDVPVIIYTEDKDESKIADCLSEGCDAVLSIPLEKEAFILAMKNAGVIRIPLLIG